MYVTMEGKKPITFEAIQLMSPTSAQLAEYVGDYYSDELHFTHKLVLEDDKLLFRHKNAPRNPLSPTLSDMFKVHGDTIHFIRDDQNEISAFSLCSERIRNIRFIRKRVE